MRKQSAAERALFNRPSLYRLKRFLIEEVIWRRILGDLFGLDLRPLPRLDGTFEGREVLIAACGLGRVSTGPPVEGASRVTAFDLSPRFAAECARNRGDWNVYCGDLARIGHRSNSFDVSVLYSTLHHVAASAEQVLTELARVTRGEIVILEGVVPAKGILRWLLLAWYRLVDGGHHYYTQEELRAAIDRLGLRVASSELHGPIRHMWLASIDCTEGALTSLRRPPPPDREPRTPA